MKSMRKNKYSIKLLGSMIALCAVLSACAKESMKFSASEDAAMSGETVTSEELSASGENVVSEEMTTPGQNASDSAANGSDGMSVSEPASENESGQENVYVHICGAVVNPGVYCLEAGSRIYELIALAGGLTDEAQDFSINQAAVVSDGMQIYIPTKEEYEESSSSGSPIWHGSIGSDAAVGDTSVNSSVPDSNAEKKQLVNINTADVAALCTLPGIGETRAKAIIDYRQQCGGFTAIEELMQVDGIKAGVYEKIKEMIRV